MILKSDAKFEEKLTCRLENDMRNLANFHQSTQSVKIGTLMESFCIKSKMYELRIYRKDMAMKNDTKIEEELTCGFKIDKENFRNYDPSNRKSKKFILIGSL